MKKHVRFISGLLAFLMVVGTFGIYTTDRVSAAVAAVDYMTYEYESEQDKLNDMVLHKTQNGYSIYVEEYTGEVAIVKNSTGQVLFTNPYDIGSITAANSDNIRYRILSQIFVEYQDKDGTTKWMYSYEEASLRNQIVVKDIKNGVRVEYSMGREDVRRLVPRMIQKERFENIILSKITSEFNKKKLKYHYVLMDPKDPELSERAIAAMNAKYPITTKMSVYILDSAVTQNELNYCENTIKTYAPEYTYEMLDEDHAITEYEGTDEAPALFRMALEYTLDDDGVTVRLAANGIEYDETTYKLLSVSILPYMGCISSENPGYTFMPDGSGALFSAMDLRRVSWNRVGSLHGPDFAYQSISGAHQEILTMPVFGAVTQVRDYRIIENTDNTESETETDETAETAETDEIAETAETAEIAETDEITETDEIDEIDEIDETDETDENGEPVEPEEPKPPVIYEAYTRSKGYLAIITEGDSLASIRYENGGTLNKYAAIYASFIPRPSDEYNLAQSISVASDVTWRVESPRKYVDSYRIRYIMLDDKDVAASAGVTDYYEATYFGMAKAYRDYLEKNGYITRLTENDVKEDMPLYIEVLGSMETKDRILSIPVTVDTPLTTFEDIITMHKELSEAGVSNINFRLRGFANGGLSDKYVPYRLKWEKSVGGSDGFKDLLAYAKEKGIGIFPDFDFAYAANNKSFDGFSYKKHAVKTIDDRYASKRYYNATSQSFVRYFEIAISPSVFDKFYTKFRTYYLDYEPIGISVATLGSDLNSDFDEDDPFNREDSKKFTIALLKDISEDYGNVMVDVGNAYTYKYVNHILNARLNSSRFFNETYSIPFVGLVLHGYINIAGNPINEEGDISNAVLKAIENGASLYFILAYRNISELKKDEILSGYYSVRYDIWFDDIVKYYSIVNDAVGDLQTALITGHEFLIGERIPDEDEIIADQIEAAERAAAEEEAKRIAEEKARRAQALAERKAAEALAREIASAPQDTALLADETEGLLAAVEEQIEIALGLVSEVTSLKRALDDAIAARDAAQAAADAAAAALAEAPNDEDAKAADEAAKAALEEAELAVTDAQAELESAVSNMKIAITAAIKSADDAEANKETAKRKTEITDDASVAASAARVNTYADSAIEKTKSALATVNEVLLNAGYEEVQHIEEEPSEEPSEGEDGNSPNVPSVPGWPRRDDEDEEEGYKRTKYTVDDGSIVLVTYETGKKFILNYNTFDVTVVLDGTTYTVTAHNFVTIK